MAYLKAVQGEGARGGRAELIDATRGQLEYGQAHLSDKLRRRHPERFEALRTVHRMEPHPLFRIVPGGVEYWEKRGKGRRKRETTG